MKSPSISLFAALLTSSIFATSASAATVIGPLNAVTGISGLTFTDNSQLYNLNVSFVSGSFDSIFSNSIPTFANNPTGGLAATLAMVDALNAAQATNIAGAPAPTPPIVFNGNVFLGSPLAIFIAVPTWSTIQSSLDPNLPTYALVNINAGVGSTWGQGFTLPPITGSDAYISAVFTSSPVPAPTTAWLFGSGLLGLIGVARRKTA